MNTFFRVLSGRRLMIAAILLILGGYCLVCHAEAQEFETEDLVVEEFSGDESNGDAPDGFDSEDGGNHLRIIAVYPPPGEMFEGRIVIYFDEDIAAPVNEQGAAVPAVLFEPELHGELSIASNYVSFALRHSVPDHTFGLSATVSPHLRSVSGRRLAESDRTLQFTTRHLGLVGVRLVERDTEKLTLELQFTVPVEPKQAVPFIEVSAPHGVPVPVSVLTESPAPRLRMCVPASVPLPLGVHIRPGLQDADGRQSTTEAQEMTFPDPMPLSIESAMWRQREDGTELLELTFSHDMRNAHLSAYMTLRNPETGDAVLHREYSRDSAKRTLRLSGDVASLQRLQIVLDPGMADDSGRFLSRAQSLDVERTKERLRVTHHYWNYQGVDGPVLRLALNGRVDISRLRECVTFTPAVNNVRVEAGTYGAINLYGDFRSEEKYVLRLSEGLTDLTGAKSIPQGGSMVRLESVPKVSGIAFRPEGKLYFPRRHVGRLIVEGRNVSNPKISLSQLFPSNLAEVVRYLQNDLSWMNLGERFAREIAVQDLALPQTPDTRVSAEVNLEDMLPADRKGVFALQVSSNEVSSQHKVVVWTNLGVLSHWLDDEIVLLVHDLYTLEPLPMAKVTVCSTKGQVMGAANTDADGIAHLKALDKGLGKPWVAVVENGDDFTFLELQPIRDDATGFTDAMPPYDRDGYDAFLYADRNLYRPGETVHARWVVRTRYGDAVPGVPLQVRLMNPRGAALFRNPVILSDLGTGGMEITTERNYPTGRYELQVLVPGKEEPVGTCVFNLEDFVPNRIRTEVHVSDGPWTARKPYDIRVQSSHLFGPPAANSRCEASIILRRGEFKSAAWQGYRFTNDEAFTPEVQSLGEAQTDEDGNAAFTFVYEPSPKISFPLRATVRGEVFEMSGRGVAATNDVLLLPHETMLGINVQAKDSEVLEVSVAAVRPDESPADLAEVQVTLEEERWRYHVRAFDNFNQPRWEKTFEKMDEQTVALSDGRGAAEFRLPPYGRYRYYRLRAHSPATSMTSTMTFYAYWDRLEVVDATRPSLIKLALSKEEYAIGEEVELRVESPFDGRGLIVVQGDTLQKTIPLLVKDNHATVRFAADRDFCPNIWIEATLAHAVQPDRWGVHPYSSFAMTNLRVRDPMRALQIAFVDAPAEIRPEQPLTVTVETRDACGNAAPAEITVAAVDEGIHAILDYENPDPAGWFSRSRRPDYRRAHYYDKVAYDFDPASVGGDAIARRLARGTAEIGENWIKPVAVWSGAVQTDADGRATVTLDIPEYDGQLRLVAVGVTRTASGAQSAQVFVRRPYVLRTGMPRFAMPGDVFLCRAAVFNTTDAPCRARIHWVTRGALETAEGVQEVAVPARSQATVTTDFRASQILGQGAIQWDCEVLGMDDAVIERLSQHAMLPVRPPATYQTHHELSVIPPGETRVFKNTRFFEDDRLESRITVGANSLFRLERAFRNVLYYPHGCLEQVTSRCFPLYVLRKYAEFAGGYLNQGETAEHYLRAGIDRMLSMQTASGGLAAWPGGTQVYPYGSLYACHFLTLVRRDRGLEVPEEAFKALQEYVRSLVAQAPGSGMSSNFMRAYAVYVLAIDGDLWAINQIERFDAITLPRHARYLLAAALALNTGDAQRVTEYLETMPQEPYREREQGDTLNTEVRNTAIELLALLQMKGDRQAVEERATALLRHIEGGMPMTTQENAFVIAALAAYFGTVDEMTDAVSGTVSGPDGDAQVQGKDRYRHERQGKGVAYTVANTGQSPLIVNFITAGIPAEAVEAEAHGIGIRRIIKDQTGAVVENGVFRHGESYVLELHIQCPGKLKNIIVSDLLPAGFEIENPRLDATPRMTTEAAAEASRGTATPEYLEIRDDRLIVAFGQLDPGRHIYRFLVRAVTAGTFQHPGMHAECMYDPAVFAITAPKTIEIK